jgi:rhamnosyltransferase
MNEPSISRAANGSNPACRVALVLVTYRPDWAVLDGRVAALRSQADEVVIVDNGSPGTEENSHEAGAWSVCERLLLKDNFGIAKAQNVGIEWAISHGATHVVLLDQDSEPASDMVARLVQAAAELAAQVPRLGAIAPRFFDERQATTPSFFRLKGLRVVPLVCADAAARLPIDAAIASGSLLSVEALKSVGGMCEDLFIDLVDIEWCLRARSLGYQSFGVCGALLHHRLGESPRSVVGRKVAHHSPLRSYYFFRNAVWLMGQQHAPVAWKLAAIRQLGLRYLLYSLTVAPRLEYLRMMTLGLWHGLKGRLGRLA